MGNRQGSTRGLGMSDDPVHIVPPDAPAYALCGVPVPRRHGLGLVPTCADCLQLEATHSVDLANLQDEV